MRAGIGIILAKLLTHPGLLVALAAVKNEMFTPHYSELIAISSFRPLEQSKEVAANQIRAKKSWDQVFEKIFLFGSFDEQLASPNTEFVECEQWPPISLLSLFASWQDMPVAILNADIVVSHGLKDMLNRAWTMSAMAVTSKRYEFDPTRENYDQAEVRDPGADFFCAFPAVWNQVYQAIPAGFRMGHQLWDSWMLSFLNKRCVRRFYDITSMRPIFHPRHGDRKMPLSIQVPPDCFYEQLGFPPAI